VTELLTPVGVHLALFLPYVVISLVSPDAVRESKVLAQGMASALVLLGLAFDTLPDERERERFRLPRLLAVAALGAAAFAAASGIRGLLSWTDPLVLVPVGTAAALFAAGASRRGTAIGERAFVVLAFAGALTGLLAGLQRTAGVFLLPIDYADARYRTAALLGSPGDVGAALVLPAVVLAAGVMDGARSRASRALRLAGLGLVLLGLASAEALTSLAAVAVGIVAFSAFDLRRRGPVLAGLAIAGLLALLAVGATTRFGRVVHLIGKGFISEAVTERDIGVRASVEMLRSRPLLGEGPGNFSNAFIRARLQAERRVGRRLVHSSTSAHFENAHNEWLTFAAECGIPAALLATVAAGSLLFHLARKRSDTLFGLLASLAVLGMASFPSRLAVVAGPGALVLGLAFRSVTRETSPARPPTVARRWKTPGLAVAALLLTTLAAARGMAVLRQAEGEATLRAAASAPPADRPYLLELARTALRQSVALRSRFAAAWLALGSTYRLDRNLEAARAALETSVALEERAETDLNLGRVEIETGNREAAMALFRRAIWILPRLRLSLPPEVDGFALDRELIAVETELARGGSPPPLRPLRP
jgi:O-antigen ligase